MNTINKMNEYQTIDKITRDSFKKRELRFNRIHDLEKTKDGMTILLKSREISIDPIIEFYNTCHSLTTRELYFHPIVISFMELQSIKIHYLKPCGLSWEPWVYNQEEYPGKVENGELMFYIPLKKQLNTLINRLKKTIIIPLSTKINSISRQIEKTGYEISLITSNELHKISIEEAFINSKYVTIFGELNVSFCSLSEIVGDFMRYRVSTRHVKTANSMMKRFNELRMVKWLKKGMEEGFSCSITVHNTYKLLPSIFNILMRMEKIIKTRIRRNTLHIPHMYISTFVKEINTFKGHHKNIWIPFYISNINYIFTNKNFSDNLIQHIYEFIYGLDKPIEYSYCKNRRRIILPQPGSLTA